MAMHILVIEDDPASLELLTYLLSQAGHAVSTATNGAAGLQAALANAYDLIVCDLQMPELSGFDVLKRLRSDASWRSVPVVAVTAYSMPGDRLTVLAAGFADYLTKPIDPESFVKHIDGHLGLPRTKR